MTTSIPRMRFTQVDEALRDERTQLAKDAQEKLGYKKLAQAILCPGALLFKLRELEIEPLSPLAVENYKRKKAQSGMWSDTKRSCYQIALALVIAFVLLPLLNKFASWSNGPNLQVVGTVLFGIVGTIIGFVGSITLLFSDHSGAHRTRREWKRTAIGEFPGNVPEFALRKAVQLKEHGASIRIDYLEESTESIPRRLPDPFLVAILGDETYYIDVWDEKEYV